MTKEEFLNSLTKEDILIGIARYILDYKYSQDIPDDVSPEDIWNTIIDLEIINII